MLRVVSTMRQPTLSARTAAISVYRAALHDAAWRWRRGVRIGGAWEDAAEAEGPALTARSLYGVVFDLRAAPREWRTLALA